MKTIELNNGSHTLVEYAQDIGIEPIILVRDGKPVAALVPIENTDIETISLSTNPQFLALIERSRSRQKLEGGLSPDEVRRTLDLNL